MKLTVQPPILPMLAKRIEHLPRGAEWIYEPKWDGFRAIIFRDGDEVLIQSRDGNDLSRYFPELVSAVQKDLPKKCAIDGEVVIFRDDKLDFDALQLRIHPAESRIRLLSAKTPASFAAFDLLAEGARDWRGKPFHQRRKQLETIFLRVGPPFYITPATEDEGVAGDWFQRFEGAGFDGIIVKSKDGVYESDKRVMYKLKHDRECDCVVAGFRWYRKSEHPAVGSLLLGLYDASRRLQHVGVCGSFPMKVRHELVDYLKPYRMEDKARHPWMDDDEATEGRVPGGKSRWSAGKDLSWEPLQIKLVAEVAYDHLQGNRFRHVAQFRRWRQDKKPKDCGFDQLYVAPPAELESIFKKNA